MSVRMSETLHPLGTSSKKKREYVGIFLFGTECSMCRKYVNGGGGEVESRSGATVEIHPNHFEIHPNPIPTGYVM